MFRQNVLKTTRLTNQVVSSARNSINHSIRFNSAVALERAPSSDVTSNSNSLSFTNSITKVADLNKQIHNLASTNQQKPQQRNNNNGNNQKNSNRGNRNNKNNRNNRNNKNYNNNEPQFNRSSPWYNQLVNIQECILQAVDLTESSNQVLFWESIKKSMDLYHELKSTPDFSPELVSLLVHALHTGLRANRSQLTRLSKKPDYDSRSFHNEMQSFIKLSLRSIIDDLLSDTIGINNTGAMHLLTSLKELKLENEAISLWGSAVQLPSLKAPFSHQKVLGVLLPMMYQSGSEFADVENLYLESIKDAKFVHPFLHAGIIKTCLAADEYQKALTYFDELCSNETPAAFSSLVDVHLAFIGESKNIQIATKFFDKAITKDIPYKLTLQVNNVKQFLDNIWIVEKDFDKVLDIWSKATQFYGRNIHHGISSSLNNTFFEIFFEKYANEKALGLNKLKEIISLYNGIKPIDEPFFNIIISKCVVWKDKPTIDSLYSAYEFYNLTRSQVSRRVYLKSLGSVEDVSSQEILNTWLDLLTFNDKEGYKYIANADWAALRDATIASPYERAELYGAVLKKFQNYCRDLSQFNYLLRMGDQKELSEKLSSIDDSFVQVPNFKNLIYNQY